MNLFISWSGDRSRAVAEILNQWIKESIQSITPWCSSEDMEPGRWSEQLAAALRSADAGLICVTKQTLGAPWLFYEAGFIAGKTDDTKVAVLALDVSPEEVTGPLDSYQRFGVNKRGLLKLFEWLNRNSGAPLETGLLHRIFDRTWEAVASSILEALADVEAQLIRGLLRGGRFSAHLAPPRSGAVVVSVLEQDMTTGEARYRRIEPGEWERCVAGHRANALDEIRRKVSGEGD